MLFIFFSCSLAAAAIVPAPSSDAGTAAEASDSLATRITRGRAYAGDGLDTQPLGRPLYEITLQRQVLSSGSRLRVTSTTADGGPFLVQVVDFDQGAPIHYTMTNTATNQRGTLEVTPTELVMQFTDNGKTKSARERRPRLFAVGASVLDLVESHAADLAAYRELTFSMVALDRLQLFDLKVIREHPKDREAIPEIATGRWMVLRLEPANGLFALFAPKPHMVVDVKSGKVAQVIGPLPSPEPGVGRISNGTIRYDLTQQDGL
jgi:hypothetical protein